MTASIALGPGREFDIIRGLLARWGDRARGIGDDAVILDVPSGEKLVVSTDSSVEDVHFTRRWLTPREIAYRATAAALSDLAAMAATPLGILVTLALPERWLEEVNELADGIGDAARVGETHVVGGDLTAARELSLGITVLGSVATPLTRSGARPGDRVYVTGRLGGPLASLRAWMAGTTPEPNARERFAHPLPRLHEARWLARHGARAAIDISDGLLGDAAHVAAASGVRMLLELDRLLTTPGVSVTDAAQSGEEYELIVTAPGELNLVAFEREFDLPLVDIGRVEQGEPSVIATAHGERVASRVGFSHFS
jgi:thiamine-monophosphate kinase